MPPCPAAPPLHQLAHGARQAQRVRQSRARLAATSAEVTQPDCDPPHRPRTQHAVLGTPEPPTGRLTRQESPAGLMSVRLKIAFRTFPGKSFQRCVTRAPRGGLGEGVGNADHAARPDQQACRAWGALAWKIRMRGFGVIHLPSFY